MSCFLSHAVCLLQLPLISVVPKCAGPFAVMYSRLASYILLPVATSEITGRLVLGFFFQINFF
jgi:hypothetical protein